MKKYIILTVATVLIAIAHFSEILPDRTEMYYWILLYLIGLLIFMLDEAWYDTSVSEKENWWAEFLYKFLWPLMNLMMVCFIVGALFFMVLLSIDECKSRLLIYPVQRIAFSSLFVLLMICTIPFYVMMLLHKPKEAIVDFIDMFR